MDTLGKYKIIEQIGNGSFGVVYRATDPIKRVVALKVLKAGWADDPQVLERFQREALAGSLFHPHIATILDFDEADGRVFFAMRFVDGPSLKTVLHQRKRLPWPEALRILKEVASALDCAHEQSMIHRDVKPANILLSPKEGAVLTDFGLVYAASLSSMSASGQVLGTPNYIAPEVWKAKGVSPATDVYSLACVAYEMVTGEILFAGDHAYEVIARHQEGAQFPTDWPEGTPAGFQAVLARGLAKDPVERYQSPLAFVQALDGLGEREKEETGKTSERQPLKPVEEKTASPDRQETVTKDQPPTGDSVMASEESVIASEESVIASEESVIASVAKQSPPIERKIASSLRQLRWRCLLAKTEAMTEWAKQHPAVVAVGAAVLIILLIIGGVLWARPGGGTAAAPPLPAGGAHNGTSSAMQIGAGYIYFVSDQKDNKKEIYISDGKGPRRVTYTDGSYESWQPFLAWDGSLYFTSNLSGHREIYRLYGKQKATRVTYTPNGGESYDPFVTRDNVLYFTTTRDGKREIYKVKGIQIASFVTEPKGNGENWAPFMAWDGSLYFTSDRSGQAEIYRQFGKDLSKVPDTKNSWGPFVTSDNSVYFTSNRDNKREIYCVQGSKITRVTSTDGKGESWDPFFYNNTVYFTSSRGGSDRIYQVVGSKTEPVESLLILNHSWVRQEQ